jgi:branched-chain amino acid transport system permease protein
MSNLLAVTALINPTFFKAPFFVQLLLGGLGNGALYAAMALTVVIIYKTTGHLNFAQGEMGTVGAFVVYVLAVEQGLPLWVGVILAVIGSMVVGAGFERFLVRPVEHRSALGVVIVTLGLFLLLNALTAIIWSTAPRPPLLPFPNGIGDQIKVLDGPPAAFVTYGVIGVWVTLLVVVLLLNLLLNRTKLGLAYRAVAANRESSLLVGIPVGRMLMFGWAISAGIGTLVAVLVSQQTSTLDFNLMGAVLLYGFAAAALGGFDSLKGAVVGGLVVGLAEALLPNLFTFIGSELNLVMALVVILVVLMVRPQGLFGSKRIERV